MLKKLLFTLALCAVSYLQLANASIYPSNQLFQKWSEWEADFNLSDLQTSQPPGNGRNFAWTQIPRIRSYGEMYQATNDIQWLDKMRDALDVVYGYKETNIQCYGESYAGWRDNSKVEQQYFPVHQGRILTAYLEFASYVYANPSLTSDYVAKADTYVAFSKVVIDSMDTLYEVMPGQLIGYYLYPKQDKVNCSEVLNQVIGPHNQSLAVGQAINILYELGHVAYQTKIEQLAEGLKVDLTTPSTGVHYEWPYWPTYPTKVNTTNEAINNTKAEDVGHGQIDIEFMQATYENNLAGLTKNDMARFAATMSNVVDQKAEFFTLRVDGTLNDDSNLQKRANNHSTTNDMRRGWLLLSKYNSSILKIGERWCINNTPHANATLFRLGGYSMSCPGWCNQAAQATFDSGNANGWNADHNICSDYNGVIEFNTKATVNGEVVHSNPTALLNARKGAGHIQISEGTNADESCNPIELGSKDLGIYRDFTLTGAEVNFEIAGFTRSLSSNSQHSSITNRSILALDVNNGYSILNGASTENYPDSSDSGWQPFNVKIDTQAATNVRAVIGMHDAWGANWQQVLRADELKVCTSGYCGDGTCSADENTIGCPLDCDTAITEINFDFQSDAQGWSNPGSTGYIYSSSNGALTAYEESTGGIHTETIESTRNLELAWYKDFASNQNVLIVDGNVRIRSSYYNSSDVTHFCVIVLDTDDQNLPELARNCANWTYTQDTGSYDFTYDFTDQVANASNIRIIVGAADQWGAAWDQKVDINELNISGVSTPQSVCGNNICDIDETSNSCPLDCGNVLATSEYDFQSGSEGWQNTNTTGYSYTSPAGELVSEEVSSGGQGVNLPEVGNMDLNWYKDFEYSTGQFSVNGNVRVSSNYSGSAKVTRYCVILLEVTSSSTTELPGTRRCKDWPNTTDSGWWAFNEDFSTLIPENSQIRVAIGSPDAWSTNWNQKVRIDSVSVTHGEMSQ